MPQNPGDLSKRDAKRAFTRHVETHEARLDGFFRAVAATSSDGWSLDFSVESLVDCKTWFLRRYWNGVDKSARPALPTDIDLSVPYWAYLGDSHGDLESLVSADLAGAYAAEVMFRDCPGSQYRVSFKNDLLLQTPMVEFWHVTHGLANSSRGQRVDPGDQMITSLHDDYVEKVKTRWDAGSDWSPIAYQFDIEPKLKVRPSIRHDMTQDGHSFWEVGFGRLHSRGLVQERARMVELIREHPNFDSINDERPEWLITDWLSEDDPDQLVYEMWLQVIEELETDLAMLSGDVVPGLPTQSTVASPPVGNQELRDTPAVRRDGSVIMIEFDDIADLDEERDQFDLLVEADDRFGEVESEDREYMVVEWLVGADPDAVVQQLWSQAKQQAADN